ncbi:hypothetical protein SERLADRAFT_411122 [Serpula lacrymans var. lacrymans S7.9]|uniref:Uncharacterized protein n=1 Tax=Serpula lacrymans var. lacrymans (strain S7.9) TaxID=578457 RepID=F8P952_SERL9|nr:uncharacterized protein SERLADRAFT_411122 [Serpula lacrymans var. lacrymans S7.9]EGO20181.1 hypothetical protein SERLADRAFT_411122 [Serpula lacrymans var. lacrymans S7.9]
MVDFAELKAKASKAKDAGVTKLSNTKDRYTSVPSSKTNWDPNWKAAPPPPPASRSTGSVTAAAAPRGPPPLPPPQRPHLGAGGSSSHGPPPVRRQNRPDDAPSPSPPPPPARAPVQHSYNPQSYAKTERTEEIDWANLSSEDKDVFFAWLDEFFSRFLNITLPPRGQGPAPPPTSRVPHISVTNHPGPPSQAQSQHQLQASSAVLIGGVVVSGRGRGRGLGAVVVFYVVWHRNLKGDVAVCARLDFDPTMSEYRWYPFTTVHTLDRGIPI